MGHRQITIDPISRIEGHAKVTLLMNEAGRVEQARLHVVEFRGFERFVQGRPYWEVPVIVQRLCGICPVSHHLAAAKAMDAIVGADRVPPTAEVIRRLMHYGQILQSHALHFFYLAAPDLLLDLDTPPPLRSIAGISLARPEVARQGVQLRRFGQSVIEATAGKRVHGTGAIPGGVNKSLSTTERDNLRQALPEVMASAREAVQLIKSHTLEHQERFRRMGEETSASLSLVRTDGCLDLYEGYLRAVNGEGTKLLDMVRPGEYLRWIAEEVRPWSYLKFPYIKALGPQYGCYRVGPLARMNVCTRIDTPEAEAERAEFASFSGGRPNPMVMAYHWARMIELLHAAEKIVELLEDPEVQGSELRATGDRGGHGTGTLEAPRGTLFHHYTVDENDQVTSAHLIVSTAQNNEAMNRSIATVAQQQIDEEGEDRLTGKLLRQIEMVVRAYDPCLSCATHAVGQMPLVVTLVDHRGEVRDVRGRGGAAR